LKLHWKSRPTAGLYQSLTIALHLAIRGQPVPDVGEDSSGISVGSPACICAIEGRFYVGIGKHLVETMPTKAPNLGFTYSDRFRYLDKAWRWLPVALSIDKRAGD
jgi:hypothetical protein